MPPLSTPHAVRTATMNPYDVISVSFKKPREPKPLHSRTDSFLVQNKKKKLSCDSGCRLRVHGTCDKVALVFAVFSSASLQLVHCLIRACAQNTLLPRALHTPTSCDGAIQLHVTCLRDNIYGAYLTVFGALLLPLTQHQRLQRRQLYKLVAISHHRFHLLLVGAVFWAVHSETAKWQCFYRQLSLCAWRRQLSLHLL
jgi:hypothetical protein